MPDPNLDTAQENALNGSLDSLTDAEILALVIGDSSLAQRLLDRFQNLAGLLTASLDSLLQVPGIGKTRAVRLKAAFTLARRVTALRLSERPIIRRPSDAITLVQYDLLTQPQEQLQVILLDANNRVLEIRTVYIGSLNATVVRVAEIFRDAIARNSAGIILVHNHPSGDATPSIEDIMLTQDMVAAGKLLDIAVIDHLIIGDGEWTSMRERGVGFQSDEL